MSNRNVGRSGNTRSSVCFALNEKLVQLDCYYKCRLAPTYGFSFVAFVALGALPTTILVTTALAKSQVLQQN